MSVETRVFGKMPDGREVFRCQLTNRKGASAAVINLGAIVHSLVVPNRDGRLEDVVLGFDTVSDYLEKSPYVGAIVGRYGNRIRNGAFALDGKTYTLATNNGAHHLHGGRVGFDKKYWELEETACENGAAVRAVLKSDDREEGYPGKLTLTVVITLTDDNALCFEYSGKSDAPTLLNPTHHGYFNLTGDPRNTVLDHVVSIDADAITPVDSGLIPTGDLGPVDRTPFDFRRPSRLGDRIHASEEQLAIAGGYDHNFVLNHFEKGALREVARVHEPTSGRLMTVYTDQPGMQLYSGNFLDGTLRGKGGVVYGKRCGLCLEAQCYPDSPNQPQFPSAVLRPGEIYRQQTNYQFGID